MLVYYNKIIHRRDTMILAPYQSLFPKILQIPQIGKLSIINENSKFNFAATHFLLLLCTSVVTGPLIVNPSTTLSSTSAFD